SAFACLFAERQPERTATLSVVGCGGMRSSPVGSTETRSWRKLTEEAEIVAAHRHNLGAMMIGDPAAIDDLAVALQHDNTRRARIDNRPIAKEGVTLRSLPNVRAPINAIWGERDLG